MPNDKGNNKGRIDWGANSDKFIDAVLGNVGLDPDAPPPVQSEQPAVSNGIYYPQIKKDYELEKLIAAATIGGGVSVATAAVSMYALNQNLSNVFTNPALGIGLLAACAVSFMISTVLAKGVLDKLEEKYLAAQVNVADEVGKGLSNNRMGQGISR